MGIHTIKTGQRLQVLLMADSKLHLHTGRLHILAAPQFLEGVAWQVDTVLISGALFTVERDGWVELQAIEASEILIQQAEPVSWWQALQQRWHGRPARAYGHGGSV